jgi:hypothetical protein
LLARRLAPTGVEAFFIINRILINKDKLLL